MNFEEFRSRDAQLNRFTADPTAACLATFFKAGGVDLDPKDVSDAHDTLQRSKDEDDILTEKGILGFYRHIRDISTDVYGSEEAANSVVQRMNKLLLSCGEDAEECWTSDTMLWLGAVCACGGPVYTLEAMEGVLEHVAEALQEHINSDSEDVPLNMQQLQDCYDALQDVGSEVVPSLTAVA